jgi:micrococcal nuclease
MGKRHLYEGQVVKIVDGDTIDLEIDLGFRTSVRVRAHLMGINAPELSTQVGRELRDLLRDVIPVGSYLNIETFKNHPNKHGTWLAVIQRPMTGAFWEEQDPKVETLNDFLVEAGFAVRL